MDELVANLRTAMGERLKTLAWMDDATRAEALKKLATFDPRIGYPVEVARLLGLHGRARARCSRTCATAARFEWQRQVARLG